MDGSPSGAPVASGTPSPARPRASFHLAAVAGVLLLGAFAYANALHGPFVFDDRQNIRDNPLVRDLGSYLGSLEGYRAQPQRFLGYLSFALNYRAGGLDVLGFHLVNVAVHLLCALAVYALVALTFRTPGLQRSALAPARRELAFAAAALFVTHPLQTQAVTYVVQRLTSLAALFYVLAVLLYAWSRLADGRPEVSRARRAAAYAGALLAALAATKTKEIAFTLPAAILLYEGVFFPARDRRLRAVLPFVAIALLIPATLVDVHGAPAGVVAQAAARARVETALARADYARTQIAVVAEYLRLLVAPAGQNLDHDFPIQHTLLAPRVLASLALLLSLLGAAAWLHRRARDGGARPPLDPAARLVAFGIAWFFVALLVESSAIPIDDVMNEHRVYLPSVGIFAAAAAGGGLLLRRVRGAAPGRLVALTAVLLGVVLAVATIRRNAVWATEVSLWADAASKSPNKVRPLNNLAPALAAAGYPEQGVAVLRRAVALEPENAMVRGQLGAALAALRRTDEAEGEIREAIRLAPDRPENLFNLGLLLSKAGRDQEASTWFRRFLEAAPTAPVGQRRFAAARAALAPPPP